MNTNSLPWHGEYRIMGVPLSIAPYPDRPVHELLYDAARRFPRNGLIQLNYRLTYREARDRVDRLATALHRLGLSRGDRVATILPTSIQFVLADYAISRAGLVHIPASLLEPMPALEHKFREGAPRALIAMADNAEAAAKVAAKCGVKHLIVSRLEDYSDRSRFAGDRSQAALPRGALWMDDLIASTPPSPPDVSFDVERDIETLLFTGGTTGVAKGCMLTHRNIYANSLQNVCVMGRAGQILTGAVAALLALPFFHSYGHIIMHTITLFGHDMMLVPDPRDTASMVRMIREYCPAIQLGVPTQFMKLSEELEGYGMLGISGSAPLPTATQERFESRAGGGIMEGYGLSEMSPCTHLNTTFLIRIFGGRTGMRINTALVGLPGVTPVLNGLLRLLGTRRTGRLAARIFALLARLTRKSHAPTADGKKRVEKRGTIGIPFPDTEVKFLSVESGEEILMDEMMRGARGEMLLRGPQRMLGYWPEAGSGLDPDGWVHTSDVVRIDEHGYFYVVDRTKDMIIVSGYKVYSREIDDILSRHPGVEMAAAVGVPDPEREGSERIVVYIQPRAGSGLTERDLTEYLRKHVARYAVPKAVRIVEQLPLTPVHKVDKKLLREMAAAEPIGAGLKKKISKKR